MSGAGNIAKVGAKKYSGGSRSQSYGGNAHARVGRGDRPKKANDRPETMGSRCCQENCLFLRLVEDPLNIKDKSGALRKNLKKEARVQPASFYKGGNPSLEAA